MRREGRQFLDEEAELSEDEDVSSDEDEGDEQNHSLQGFVVNTTQCSQGLNGEIHCLKHHHHIQQGCIKLVDDISGNIWYFSNIGIGPYVFLIILMARPTFILTAQLTFILTAQLTFILTAQLTFILTAQLTFILTA